MRTGASPRTRLPANLAGCILLLGLNSGEAGAWSSKNILLFEPVHQNAISRVLSPRLQPADIALLEQAQVDADKQQKAEQSHLHAMTGVANAAEKPDKPRDEYIERTERTVRSALTDAIAARKSGDTAAAMRKLGAAVHILTDATSPAHAGFQPWDYDETVWQQARHVLAERVTPNDAPATGLRAHLDAAVLWGFEVYQESVPMPERFFAPHTGAMQFPQRYGVR
jgi:hypothetical protein